MPPIKLINPLTGEVKFVSRAEGRRLRGYGWRPATTAEVFAFRQRIIQSVAFKHMVPSEKSTKH